jgi:hypothetical protein
LPDHRKQIEEACLRQGMFPLMMEHRPSSDADAIGFSIELVDKANIYVGVFANRYGYVPAGHAISITEMEYDRAVLRGIPRLNLHHGQRSSNQDCRCGCGRCGGQAEDLKDRVGVANITNPFKSPLFQREVSLGGNAYQPYDYLALSALFFWTLR